MLLVSILVLLWRLAQLGVRSGDDDEHDDIHDDNDDEWRRAWRMSKSCGSGARVRVGAGMASEFAAANKVCLHVRNAGGELWSRRR